MICSARANLPQVQARNGEIKQNRWVCQSFCVSFCPFVSRRANQHRCTLWCHARTTRKHHEEKEWPRKSQPTGKGVPLILVAPRSLVVLIDHVRPIPPLAWLFASSPRLCILYILRCCGLWRPFQRLSPCTIMLRRWSVGLTSCAVQYRVG